MRRFIVLIVVLVVLVIAADRAAWWFAERTIAQEIQKSENLADRPDVAVAGFPFLTQVLRGNYEQIDVGLQDPAVEGGLKIDSLDVRLSGVRIAARDALDGNLDSIPVDSATAVATVSFASLNAAAKENLPNTRSSVVFGPGEAGALAVTGNYRSSGLSARLDLDATLRAEDGDLVVELAPGTLDGLPAVVRPQVEDLLAEASQLPSLPFGFQAQSVTVAPTGITVQARSASLDLGEDIP